MTTEEKDILLSLEKKVLDFEYALEFQKQINETHNSDVKTFKASINEFSKLTKHIDEQFELVYLKLKTKDSEIALLNKTIENLQLQIDLIKLKSGQ